MSKNDTQEMIVEKEEPIFEVVQWNTVAVWHYYFAQEGCAICQGQLHDVCPYADQNVDPCSILVGNCKHAYHKHCLNNWLKNDSRCPMCSAPFEVADEIHFNT
eukprot:TRINITY_DN3272_c0_g3_i2.p1 TRINITY_DN3272_c0_g3~~TRINITY_DN3272_c0_g3_i2.p1  ORF type:complete len:103 (-),score=24.70 TRINITY_DN3272_c0_g3_i2:186-494(-)